MHEQIYRYGNYFGAVFTKKTVTEQLNLEVGPESGPDPGGGPDEPGPIPKSLDNNELESNSNFKQYHLSYLQHEFVCLEPIICFLFFNNRE